LAEKLRGTAVPGRAVSAARVNRNAIVWGGAALFFAAGGTQARAQNESVRNPFAVEVGSYLPVEADGRNAGGRYMWLVEANYTIQNLPEYNSAGVFSIGYTERDDLRIIPFTLSQIVRGRDTVFTQNNYFWGVGVGLYSVRLAAPDTSGTNKILFGFDVQGGIDINPRLFLDVKYHYISKYDGKFVGGFQVGVGGRF
jgi:hypothetical protein